MFKSFFFLFLALAAILISGATPFKYVSVIYLQFYTYASQDSLGLYKVNPSRKSLRPLQNFPL